MGDGVKVWLGGGLVLALLIAVIIGRAQAELPGDSNCDGVISADDVAAVVDQFFRDAMPCAISDVNGDGRMSSADIVSSVMQATAPAAHGPIITYLGLAGADGARLSPVGDAHGAPVYTRSAGSGFRLVVEAKSGVNGVQPGHSIMNSDPLNPTRRPDVWIISSSALGDGSLAVCDGGVPAVEPPSFGPTQRIANALNDLACNLAVSTSASFACTQDSFGTPAFLGAGTQVQYCLLLSRTLALPDADTLVTVVVRDTVGNLGPVQQLVLRVGIGPFATFTPTSSPTPVLPTRTFTMTRTPTLTRTPTATQVPTSTRTPTSIPSFTRTFTATATVPPPTITSTRTPTRTHPPATVTPTPPLVTGSPTRTPTPTRSPTLGITATSTRTPTKTPTRTRTSTPGPPTRTATRTPTGAAGPVVTFFGLARSDDTLFAPSTTSPEGIPIYVRSIGFGFSIVVEAKRGPSGLEVGLDSFVDTVDALPDLQIVASNALGDGSDQVCDSVGANAGGVPALDPPSFVATDANIRIINDLACRFVDGQGFPKGRSPGDACTRVPPSNDFGLVSPDSTTQFCASVTRAFEFPPGDTVLTVRLLDQIADDAPAGSGTPGNIAQLIVRVGDVVPPTATLPVQATATPVPTASRTRTATLTRTATPPLAATTATRSATPTPSRSATPPAPTATGVRSATVTPSRTRTATRTPSATAARSNTPVRSPVPTCTSGPLLGPPVTFFGVARFDGTLINPIGTTIDGTPIYSRPVGAGFILVVEGARGCSLTAVGPSALADDSNALPDLQIVASRALGNGSPEVCDYIGIDAGGVPAVDPPDFDAAQNAAAINDLACRFRDGLGDPVGRGPNDACVVFESGDSGFVGADTSLQFCAQVDSIIDFPGGDTTLTVRLRDVDGNVGASARIVVRIPET